MGTTTKLITTIQNSIHILVLLVQKRNTKLIYIIINNRCLSRKSYETNKYTGNAKRRKLKTKLVVTQYGSNPNPNNSLPSANGFLSHPRIYYRTKYVTCNHFLNTRYFSPHIPWLALCIPAEWISERLVVTANISAGTYVLAFLHTYHFTSTNITTLNFALKTHSQNVNTRNDFNRGARTNKKRQSHYQNCFTHSIHFV